MIIDFVERSNADGKGIRKHIKHSLSTKSDELKQRIQAMRNNELTGSLVEVSHQLKLIADELASMGLSLRRVCIES